MGIYSTSIFHYVSRKHRLSQKMLRSSVPPCSAAAQARSRRTHLMTLHDLTMLLCGDYIFTQHSDAKQYFYLLLHSSVSDSKWDQLDYIIESRRRCLLDNRCGFPHQIKVRWFDINDEMSLCMICFYCLWQENLISAIRITIYNLILHHCLNPLPIIFAQGCCWNQIIANPI